MSDIIFTEKATPTAPAATKHIVFVKSGTERMASENSSGTVAIYPAGDGWTPITDTWTYASASTITVPTDATTYLQKGVKLRFKQGGGYKYYYGTTVAATLLTVTGGSDYTVANAAITDIAYSYAENPYGFPLVFNWSPTFGGFSTAPTVTAKYSYNSGKFSVQITSTVAGTSNATSFTITNLPISALMKTWFPIAAYADNSTLASGGVGTIEAGGTTVTLSKVNLAIWTNTGNKYADFEFSYFA